MSAAVTDQAIADLFADINAVAVRLDTAAADLDTLQSDLTSVITAWAEAEAQERSAWNTSELRRIEIYKNELIAIVSAYVTKLRKHLSASAPDATHNGQPDPSTSVTPFPAGFKVKTHRYSLHPESGKVEGTWVPGYVASADDTSQNNSTYTPLGAGATWTGTATTTAGYSSVTLQVASPTAATLTVRMGDTIGVTGASKTFTVAAGVTLYADVRFTKDTVNTQWEYFRVELRNDGVGQSSLSVVSDRAREADPAITFRPIFNGFLREECATDGTNDRYMIGGKKQAKVYPRTSYWAVTPHQYDSANLAATNSTTGAVERIITPFAARVDAPVEGCSAVENRMFVPIYRTAAAT